MRLAAALVLCALPAAAHQMSVSFSELDVRGAEVHAQLRFSLADVRTQMQLDSAALPLPALRALLLEPFALKGDGRACAVGDATAQLDGGDGLLLRATWRCPAAPALLDVRVGFIDSFPAGHTHLSRITFAGEDLSQRVADAQSPSFEVARAASLGRDLARFVRLGIEHIFTGYDHLAFLLALLLLGGTVRELVRIVTAFTVAHSVTLALATLGVLQPSSRVVEPAIAASIVYVGLENVWALRRAAAGAALRHRWMLTFAFGLVHGFGFASVLRELELPRASLATALVSFNLGVEAGQLCIVLAAVPLLRRARLPARAVTWLSFVLAALGALWLLQRLSAS